MDVGSLAFGAWIVRLVFVILVVESAVQERLRTALIAVALVIVGWLLLSRINPYLLTSFVAMVDIGLVLVVLGRDIRLN